jgi:hypothetical protein
MAIWRSVSYSGRCIGPRNANDVSVSMGLAFTLAPCFSLSHKKNCAAGRIWGINSAKRLDILANSMYNRGMSRQERSRMGRPRFPRGRAKSARIGVRLEPGLYQTLLVVAKRAGKPLATWIRDVLARAAEQENERAEP